MKSIALAGKKIRASSNSENNKRSDDWKINLSRQFIFKMFERITVGSLILRDSKGVYYFGDAAAQPKQVGCYDYQADITVNDWNAYRRVMLGGSIGSAESYMLGEWTCVDITSVVRLMLANKARLENMESKWSVVRKMFGSVADFFRVNSLSGSKKNICAHYDLSNNFFSLFLDSGMMYSSAIYPDEDASLEQASSYKLKHICERLNLKQSDHLIEIGSGWGGMAIYAAKNYGCKVTTTTISDEQYRFARKRIAEEGLESRITLLNKDYRLLEGTFDKLVSIEMIEAVGHRFYKHFFKKCNSLLKDDGLALIQGITTGDHRFEGEKNKTDFIRRYIFPGGCLPSNNVIANMLTKFTNMQCVGYDDITLHYSRTLKDWRIRFMQQLDGVRAQGFDDVFINMWEFYLAYCEGGFAERAIHTGQFVFAKPQARRLPSVLR